MITTTIIDLKAGDTVRAAAWHPLSVAEVGTVEDYAIRNGDDVETRVAQAVSRGHKLAYAMSFGTMLLGDRKAAAAKLAEDRARADRAFTVKTGDVVRIRGRLYTVKFAGTWGGNKGCEFKEFHNYSDPIQFVPAKE